MGIEWRAVQVKRGSWTRTRVQATLGGVTGTPSVLIGSTVQQKAGRKQLEVIVKPGLNIDKLARLTKPVFCCLHLGSLTVALHFCWETGLKILEKSHFNMNIVQLPCQSPPQPYCLHCATLDEWQQEAEPLQTCRDSGYSRSVCTATPAAGQGLGSRAASLDSALGGSLLPLTNPDTRLQNQPAPPAQRFCHSWSITSTSR